MSAARRLLPSRADAEDAVQDTYVRALTAFPSLAEPQAAWLHTVLRNIAIDHLRRNQRESQHEQIGSPPEGSLRSQADVRVECEAALRHLLERVRLDEAAAILLSDVFEFDCHEIGRTIGKSAATARQYLHRARMHARRSVSAKEFEEDYVALCWRAIEACDPAPLLDMLQVTTVRAQHTPITVGQRGARSFSKLVQINGQYAIALMLDGIVLCIVPVGTQTTAVVEL